MSHVATKWAFDQPEIHRDMKPAEWAVLVILADCHNPVNGCFPSQDYIANRTNISERAVRDHLGRLRERKLVNFEAKREDGHRASNRYKLAFEPDFQPAESAGSSGDGSTGKNEQEQPAESDQSNRQNLPPNLVREPVSEPVISEREGAREAEKKPSPKPDDDPRPWERDKAFMRSVHAWGLIDSLAAAWREWSQLDDDAMRKRAETRIPVYQAMHAQRSNRVAFSTYLRERMFEHIPDPTSSQATEKPVSVDRFTKDFWAVFFRRRAADPSRARHMLSMAMQYRFGPSLPLAEMPTDAERSALIPVESGGEAFKAWARYLASERCRIDHDEIAGQRIFVPSEYPPGWVHDPPEDDEFERESERQGEGRT